MTSGVIAVVGVTSAGAALLYYVSLPAHPGPENSSPPPEGIGLIFGAALGCFLGTATVAFIQRSAARALTSACLAFALAAVGWLAFGPGAFGDRVGDSLLGALVLRPPAAAGVLLGALVLRASSRRTN